jgi:hypothetical protein
LIDRHQAAQSGVHQRHTRQTTYEVSRVESRNEGWPIGLERADFVNSVKMDELIAMFRKEKGDDEA